MSVTVKLYTFSKRENSTAQPTGGTSFNCTFKDPTSIIDPVILIDATSVTSYNYAYIASFNRYYFIQDIVSVSTNLWEISLECDVLASYKSQIGSSSEYILRSASDWDGDVMDDLYPIKAETTLTVGSSSSGGSPGSPTTGTFEKTNITYIVGILNNTTTDKFGAVKYYAMTPTELGNLMSYLLGGTISGHDILTDTDTFINQLSTEIQNGIARSLSNPTQYIVESYALPYAPDQGSQETVTIGWWPSPLTGNPLVKGTNDNYTYAINSGDLDLPSHPQAATRGHYLSTSPYLRYWLYLGIFGFYPLDTLKAIDSTKIHYSIYGDMFGNVKCQLSLGGAIIDTLSANVKNNFPIGQVSMDALGGASAMLSTVVPTSASAASADEARAASASGLIKGASGILSAAGAMLPQARVSGSAGTFTDVFQPFISYAETHEVVDDDLAQRGRPLCKVKQISSLSGYILVSDPDIAISGTAEENSRIKTYMANGFYYE